MGVKRIADLSLLGVNFLCIRLNKWLGLKGKYKFSCQRVFKGSIGFRLFLLKTEKYCNKIIFKCVNSVVRLIFNESIVEKKGL